MRNLRTSFWKTRERRCRQFGKPRVNLEDFSDMLHFDTEQEKAVIESPAAVSAQGEFPKPAGILEMDFARIEPFPNHKLKLYEGQQLADMVESIRQFGVLLPHHPLT